MSKLFSGSSQQTVRASQLGQGAYQFNHVLILDDEPDVLEILSELLREEGYWVTTSTRLLEIDLVKQLSPGLILLDLVFDGVQSGIGFLTSIREDPNLFHIPVIICTGASYLFNPADIEGSLTILEIVEKPFDLDAILVATQRSLPVSPQPAAD
jgi:CheY-like chemotaxis protein